MKNTAHKIWEGYSKVKYPTLLVGTEEYRERRHAFFIGMWAAMGIIQKTPESAIDSLFAELHAEIKAELTRDTPAHIVNNALNHRLQ